MTCVVDDEKDLQFFTHKFVVPKREEEIPNYTKDIRTAIVERAFDKDKSVFKDFKVDTEESLTSGIEHDLELWHADKFIKDEDDLAATANVMRKYA